MPASALGYPFPGLWPAVISLHVVLALAGVQALAELLGAWREGDDLLVVVPSAGPVGYAISQEFLEGAGSGLWKSPGMTPDDA